MKKLVTLALTLGLLSSMSVSAFAETHHNHRKHHHHKAHTVKVKSLTKIKALPGMPKTGMGGTSE